MDTPSKTQMAEIMVRGRSSDPSWKEFVWSCFGRTVVGKAIWENPIEAWLGEKSKLGMSLCTSWKRIILICVCGWLKKLAGKKQNINPMWKVLNKEVDLGEPTSFLDHVYLGCTQRQCEISQRYCGQLQNHVWIANFRGVNRKTATPSKSSYFFVVLRCGRSCKEMCGAILWVSQQIDATTLQSIYSMQHYNFIHKFIPMPQAMKIPAAKAAVDKE